MLGTHVQLALPAERERDAARGLGTSCAGGTAGHARRGVQKKRRTELRTDAHLAARRPPAPAPTPKTRTHHHAHTHTYTPQPPPTPTPLPRPSLGCHLQDSLLHAVGRVHLRDRAGQELLYFPDSTHQLEIQWQGARWMTPGCGAQRAYSCATLASCPLPPSAAHVAAPALDLPATQP